MRTLNRYDARRLLAIFMLVSACGEVTEDPNSASVGGEGGASVPVTAGTAGALSLGGSMSAAGKPSLGGTASVAGGSSAGGASTVGGDDSAGGAEYGGAPSASGGVTQAGSPSAGGVESMAGAATAGARASAGAGGSGGSGAPDDPGGAGGSGPTEPPVWISSPQSWDVQATLTVIEPPATGPTPNCSHIAFTLRTELTLPGSPSGQVSAIASRDGELCTAYLSRGATTYGLPDTEAIGLPARGSCPNCEVALEELSLTAQDVDGDGVVDRLSGTGTGTGAVYVGIVRIPYSISVEIIGVPDVTPPSLVTREPRNPLDRSLSIDASEILVPDAEVQLSTAPEVDLDRNGRSEAYTTGFLGGLGVLPFSGTWTMSSTATDFAGLRLDPNWSLRTIADPGIFPEDGFEGPTLLAALTGSVKRVTQVGNIPALDGQTSLLVAPGSSATLHLARRQGTTRVYLHARTLQAVEPLTQGGFPIEAGVLGTDESLNTESNPGLAATVATTDPTWPYAGTTINVMIPLTQAGEVVLRVAGDPCEAPCPTARALLVDDVHME